MALEQAISFSSAHHLLVTGIPIQKTALFILLVRGKIVELLSVNNERWVVEMKY